MMKVLVWCHFKHVNRLHTAHIVFIVTLLYNYCDHYCDFYFPLTCFIILSIQTVRWLSSSLLVAIWVSQGCSWKRSILGHNHSLWIKQCSTFLLTAVVRLTPRLWQPCDHWGSFPLDIEYLEWLCIVWDRTHQTNSINH